MSAIISSHGCFGFLRIFYFLVLWDLRVNGIWNTSAILFKPLKYPLCQMLHNSFRHLLFAVSGNMSAVNA